MEDQAEKTPKKAVVMLTDAECAEVRKQAAFYSEELAKLPEWWRTHPDYLNGYALAQGACENAVYLLDRNMRFGKAAEYIQKAKDYYEYAHERISDWASDIETYGEG